MSLALAPNKKSAWSVAADHFVCRYDLFRPDDEPSDSDSVSLLSTLKGVNDPLTLSLSQATSRLVALPTPAPGRSMVAVRDDGKLVAVSGWDGEYVQITLSFHFSSTDPIWFPRARLYSAKTGEPLAVLSYHRMSLHALAFAPTRNPQRPPNRIGDGDDEESSDEEEGASTAWMATGGKDDRISLWDVYPPARS